MRFGCCGSMISPAADPVGVASVEAMAALGFDYAELSLSHMARLEAADFRAFCDRVRRSGLSCEACNNFFPPDVRLTGPAADLALALGYADEAMARAAELGVQVIVFGSSGAKNVPAGFPHDRAWEQIVQLLQRLGPPAGRRGVTIAVEALNRGESNIVNRVEEGIRLVEEVGHPNVQLLADFYHMAVEGEDWGVLARAGAMIRHAHVAAVEGRRFPAAGDARLTTFFARLTEAGYTGRCSIEAYTDAFTTDAPPALRLLRNEAETARQA